VVLEGNNTFVGFCYGAACVALVALGLWSMTDSQDIETIDSTTSQYYVSTKPKIRIHEFITESGVQCVLALKESNGNIQLQCKDMEITNEIQEP